MSMRLVSTRCGEVRRAGQARVLSGPAQTLLRELKSKPCVDCGGCYHPEAMEFDHIPGRGGKLHNVSRLKTVRAILAEAEKCELVCANCHRVRTSRRRLDRQNVRRARQRKIQQIGRED